MSSAPPAWETLPHNVPCPLCDYNLRGLADPRCPECGYTFDWPAVLDPDRRAHPYLFEHHPERNVWSFRRTLVATFWPFKFWRSLSPAQPSSPRRIRIYWLITWAPLLTWVTAEWIRAVILISDFYSTTSISPHAVVAPRPMKWNWKSVWELTAEAWRDDAPFNVAVYFTAFYLLWPSFTLLVMRIFRQSMCRARIGLDHVRRCLIYSHDLSAWYGLPLAALTVSQMSLSTVESENVARIAQATLLAILTIAVIVRVGVAFRLYLRFDHPFWTVIATQVIVFLSLFAAVLTWQDLHRHSR